MQPLSTTHSHPPHGMSANLIKLCSGPRNIPPREGDYIDWRCNLLDVSFEMRSVNPQPWRFTHNSLGLPPALSLSVCLFLWFFVVCGARGSEAQRAEAAARHQGGSTPGAQFDFVPWDTEKFNFLDFD